MVVTPFFIFIVTLAIVGVIAVLAYFTVTVWTTSSSDLSTVDGSTPIESDPSTPDPSVPDAPYISSISSGNSELTVNFTAGLDGGSSITNYQYSTDNGSSWETLSPASTISPIVITGLTNGIVCNVVIRAINSVGNGTSSNMVTATPMPNFITNDLVLYYDFGNIESYPGSGTSVTDLSSNDYTGNLVNGPSFSSVNEGILNFDGTNDYINTNNSIDSESFTINAWFKISNVSVPRMLISKEENVVGGAPWNYRMYLDASTGYLIGDIAQTPVSGGGSGDSASIGYNTNLADNLWHLTTFSRNSITNTIKLYVDGVLVNESPDGLSGSITNSQDVWIGQSAIGGGSYPLSGSIGSVFIYDRALTDEEVDSNYLVTKSRFEAGPGVLFTTPSNSVNVSTVAQSPFVGGGNSYSFNGTSSYLSVISDESWDFGTHDFTIEWFQYQTDNTRYPRIFAIGVTPSTTSIGCSIETPTGNIFYVWTGPPVAATSFGTVSSPTPYKNTWVHFAIVRNSGILRVYKNGSQIGSNVSNAKNISNSLPLYFGVEGGNVAETWFGGYLTNIRFVKGLAVYTGNFNKPTSALTGITTVNPYGGSNTQAIPSGYTKLLFVP